MYGRAGRRELTRSEFDAARLGFLQVLRRKRMSPQFIDRHGEDLFAQAAFEYSRQLAEGKEIANPPAWIITCAWHRTVGLLETRDWRPRLVSTERAGELPAEAADAPEEELLSEDRYRKVREAVERLPAHQRALLALSYFEGESVREAARRLRWTPSKAQRAHEAAQRRLHELLGVESSDDLAIEVGLAAFLSLSVGGSRLLRAAGALESTAHRAAEAGQRALDLARHPFGGARPSGGAEGIHPAHELGRSAVAGGAEAPAALAARGGGRRLGELGRRFFTSGAAETASAAAGGGGDRVAEVCKAALAVCLIGGSAVGGALLGSGQRGRPRPRPRVAAPAHPHHARPATTVAASEEPARSPPATPEEVPVSSSASSEVEAPATAAKDSKSSRSERRAERRESEEASAEEQFDAFARAASEPEAAPVESAAASQVGGSPSGQAGEVEARAPPEGAKAEAEEAQLERQFRGGLP